LSDLDETGPGLVDTFATGIEANVGRAQKAGESVAGAAQPEGESTQDFAAGRTIENRLFIDGREVTRGTEQYRNDETTRRGL